MTPVEPRYLHTMVSGQLHQKAQDANHHMACCDLCARHCHVDRKAVKPKGVCQTGLQAVVASFGPHHGEEAPLSGTRGSGTIFFSHCNLRCVFCQNWEISWKGEGREVSDQELAGMMLTLQSQGCHNINFVSPSHVISPILNALIIAVDKGLRLPLVYNTGGYDSPEGLALLDGVIDIYMPDMKYGATGRDRRFSRARDYPRINQEAVGEMHRQVGDLILDQEGMARRGLLVRHLVMPGKVAASEKIFQFLAEQVSKDTYLNIMPQYRPCFRAARFPPLDGQDIHKEYLEALESARSFGLWNLDNRQKRGGFF